MDSVTVREPITIGIGWDRSSLVGSCNVCSGGGQVLVVDLKSMQFRLCRECARKLKGALVKLRP